MGSDPLEFAERLSSQQGLIQMTIAAVTRLPHG